MSRFTLLATTLLLAGCGAGASATAARDAGLPDASLDRVTVDNNVRDVREGPSLADADDAQGGRYIVSGPCLVGAYCLVWGLDSGVETLRCDCAERGWTCQGARIDALPPAYNQPELPRGDFTHGGACRGVGLDCVLPGCIVTSCQCASDGSWSCQRSGPC